MSLDGKGRISVPARHRDALAALSGNQLTLTQHPVGCLLVFPRPAWEGFRAQLMGLPMEADGWRRFFVGSAVDIEIDSAARVLVPPELRAMAGLDKDVLLLGVTDVHVPWQTLALSTVLCVVLPLLVGTLTRHLWLKAGGA